MRTPALCLLLLVAGPLRAMPPPPGPEARAQDAQEREQALRQGIDVATLRARGDLLRLRAQAGSRDLAGHRALLREAAERATRYLAGMQRSEISDTLTNAQRQGLLAGALQRIQREPALLLRWMTDARDLAARALPGEAPGPRAR